VLALTLLSYAALTEALKRWLFKRHWI